MEQKKICAAYIRVSTDDQLDYSPESQIKLIQDYAKKNNMVLPPEYIFRDDGISGRTAKKRPGFLRMIAAAKEKPRPFEVILVWKFSRFARNQEESVVYKSLLKKENDIDVVSISEPLIEGPFGGLIERIIEWFDAFYSVNLATEVRRGMTERVRQGGAVSPAPIGYVYKERKLAVEPTEAETVRMIYRDFLNGSAMIAIAKKLNGLGIKTKRGGAWENRTVRYVLTNPVYTGKVRWSPEGANDYHKAGGWSENTMLVDGEHEAIIPEEIFEAVQKQLEGHISRLKGSTDSISRREEAGHMLQGLVKCSACGGTLTRSGRGQMNCARYLHGRCTESHGVKEEVLIRVILEAIRFQFETLDFQFVQNDGAAPKGEQESILRLIKQEQLVLARCKEAYAAGIDTLEEYRENKIACKSRIDALQQKLNESKTQPVDKQTFAGQHRDALRLLEEPSVSGAEKNKIMRSFIDHITYFKDLKTIDILYRA